MEAPPGAALLFLHHLHSDLDRDLAVPTEGDIVVALSY